LRPYRLALAALLFSLASACAAREADPGAADARDSAREEIREPFRVLSPREPVPRFRVVAHDGRIFDSDELVGKRPFIVVFFATWCGVCEMLFPAVHELFDQNGDVPVIAVSLDDADTFGQVPGYVARHRLALSWVRAESFPRFTLAYDPLQRVPVVAVVGKSGYLVDYQIGYSLSERQRLARAIEIARRNDGNASVPLPGDDSSL
jgi:thiol-disulfide isomerase/thioredoxin